MALTPATVVRANYLTLAPLASTMNEIRMWLDSEKIEPSEFKMIVSREGLGFEISFKSEEDAERFQRQFPTMVGE
jgi:hypothetical protein